MSPTKLMFKCDFNYLHLATLKLKTRGSVQLSVISYQLSVKLQLNLIKKLIMGAYF